MFAYIVIGIELAILYFIFWVVFIREPNPREIRAELWGRYYDWDKSIAEKTQAALPAFSFLDRTKPYCLPSIIKIRAYKMAKSIKPRRHQAKRKYSSCSCLCHLKNEALNNGGSRREEFGVLNQGEAGKKLAERFLLLLNQTLNRFSVKMP